MAEETGERSDCDVLILGASFAGVELVHRLRRDPVGRGLTITVVDRQPAHGYIPLVQERMVGRLPLDRSELATARFVAARPGARYVVGEVRSLDPARKEVALASGERLRGRFIVVALGSILAPPPAIDGAERFVGYNFAGELDDARARLAALLGAPGTSAPAIVVVGGGISGVELAGELAHLARQRPPGWRAPKVVLVHGGDRLLPGLTERAGRKAQRHLAAQGVDLRLGARVVRLSAGTAAIQPRGSAVDELPCDLAFWAGGVRPAPALADLGLPRTHAGWLAVGPTLQCFATPRPTQPDIFAIGDAARIQGGAGEWPTMQRAIECLWQAGLTAKNLCRLAVEPPGYPRGVPPLAPHVLREDFPHGVSVGGKSLIVYGPIVLDLAAINTWFRRFLMRQYFARYRG